MGARDGSELYSLPAPCYFFPSMETSQREPRGPTFIPNHLILTSPTYLSVAKDRGWFTEYTPFRSRAYGRNIHGQLDPGAVLDAYGFGTVELCLRQDPNNHALTRTIVLEGVLHVPQLPCNIISCKRLKTDLGPRLASSETSMELCSEPLPGFPNGRVLLKRPLDDNSIITIVWTYFQNIQQPDWDLPQGQEELNERRPHPRLVELARIQPRACTFGESRFQQMLIDNGEWFQWIVLPPDQQARLLEALRVGNRPAGRRGPRPRTQLAD